MGLLLEGGNIIGLSGPHPASPVALVAEASRSSPRSVTDQWLKIMALGGRGVSGRRMGAHLPARG
jgi:hypothetical protein